MTSAVNTALHAHIPFLFCVRCIPYMSFVTDRFPVINSLIVRINVRKRRDTLILGGVIAVCLILLLWYTLH